MAVAKLILGVSVPLPDAGVLGAYVRRGGQPLLRLYDALGGGALAKGSAFALGIMPYVSARLFVAIATRTGAKLEGAKRKWWIRGLTVGYSLVQSYGYARWTQQLPGAVSQPGVAYTAEVMLMLTSVSTLLMLLAEEATASPAEEAAETPMLPRERAVEHHGERRVGDPLYVSHPTPHPRVRQQPHPARTDHWPLNAR